MNPMPTYAKLFRRADRFARLPKRKRQASIRRQQRRAKSKGWRIKQHLFRLYGARCMACGATHNLTLDHILPLSRGGLTHLNNAQILCKGCNEAKGVEIIDCRPLEVAS